MMRNTKPILAIVLTVLISATLALAADVAGPWKVVVDVDGDLVESLMTIEQNGTEITAKVGEDVITGSLIDDVLTLTGKVYYAAEGYRGDLKMTGKLSGDKIAGKLTWDMNPATFTMTREK